MDEMGIRLRGNRDTQWRQRAGNAPCLRFSEVLENYLHLKGVKLFAGLDVLGGMEVGHKVGIGVNLASKEAAGNFFVIAREISLGQILFECVT